MCGEVLRICVLQGLCVCVWWASVTYTRSVCKVCVLLRMCKFCVMYVGGLCVMYVGGLVCYVCVKSAMLRACTLYVGDLCVLSMCAHNSLSRYILGCKIGW